MKNNLTSIAREGNAKSSQNTGGASQHEALIIAEQFSQVRTSRLDGVPVTNGWMLTPGEDRAMTERKATVAYTFAITLENFRLDIRLCLIIKKLQNCG